MNDIIELEPADSTDSMETLIKKDLVFRYSGTVMESNIDWFVTAAESVLSRINTTLETDDDFEQAKKDVDDCKTLEIRIHNLREKAISSTEGLSDAVEKLNTWEKKFSQTRLDLDKKIVTEKDRKKKKITDAAKAAIKDLVESSPVKHAFAIDFVLIDNAVKNKRSVKSMEEAVETVRRSEIARLVKLEQDFQLNMSAINKSEEEYPGLFPDKKNLALSSPEIVETQIINRVLQYKISMQEKAKKDEDERLAKEVKEKTALPPEQPKAPEIAPEPFAQWTPPPPPGEENSATEYILTVTVTTADISKVVSVIRDISGVGSVNIKLGAF